MEDEQVIRDNMERTRESLTEKLEALQEKVLGTVEEATSAVRETVTNVKETMQEGVESVKEAVDVPAHVEKRPWLMFGGAMLGGFLLMTALTRDRIAAAVPRRMAVPTPPPTPKRHTPGNGHHKTQTAPAAAPQESIADKASSLLSAFEPEVNRLKSLALGMALGTVRELLTKDARLTWRTNCEASSTR